MPRKKVISKEEAELVISKSYKTTASLIKRYANARGGMRTQQGELISPVASLEVFLQNCETHGLTLDEAARVIVRMAKAKKYSAVKFNALKLYIDVVKAVDSIKYVEHRNIQPNNRDEGREILSGIYKEINAEMSESQHPNDENKTVELAEAVSR